MRIDILTLFPEMVDQALSASIIGRGREAGLLDIRCHNIRDYSPDKRRRTDDYPYGGGQGMVMQCEPLARCLEEVQQQEDGHVHTVLMSPAGTVFTQQKARELLAREHIILVCGHYEGVDQRFVDECVDEQLSIGDFVLTGGELAAMVINGWLLPSADMTLWGVTLPVELLATAALLPIWLYRGRQGPHSPVLQGIWYAFYPAHLLLLWWLARSIGI